MTDQTSVDPRPDDDAEQLALLPSSDAHVQFLLSRDTRERGLRHVAEIRRQLADQARHNAHPDA
ncbi:MAG: hypothetical protein ACR2O6_05695, partial [Ilumatobacteraceae bacterium]